MARTRSLADRPRRQGDAQWHWRGGVGYNVQIAVDTKHKLIAEQQVPSQVSDLGLLAETGRAARTSLGVERIDAVADKGYFKVEDSAGCEAAGITPYVPKPRRSPARRSGRFPKERFRYDAGTDTYACPNGQQLKPLYISRVRDTTLMHYANRGACRGTSPLRQTRPPKSKGPASRVPAP